MIYGSLDQPNLTTFHNYSLCTTFKFNTSISALKIRTENARNAEEIKQKPGGRKAELTFIRSELDKDRNKTGLTFTSIFIHVVTYCDTGCYLAHWLLRGSQQGIPIITPLISL